MSQDDTVILVVSDSVLEARQVQELLLAHFKQVRVSAQPEQHVSDFEQHKPGVLVLAFKDLERAESYYLGLYRRSRLAPALPHRTLILCHKDEVKRCHELCRTECFDDYVLFWPMTYDGLRLPMSVLLALRSLGARQTEVAHGGGIVRLPERAPLPVARFETGSASGAVAPARLQPALAQPVAGSADPGATEEPRKTILIVDDDAFQCKLLGKLLADLNCELRFVRSGEEVLTMARKVQPCLILMDIMLPGINGVEVTHQLKSTPALAQIPVMMITGNSDRLAVAKSLKAGAIDFVVKPFNREILRRKVEKFLE